MIFSDPALKNQRIKRLLHLQGAGVQLVQEQTERLLSDKASRRTEHARSVYDLWHADQILRRKLASGQADTGKAELGGKLFNNGGFADARRTPDKDRPDKTDVQKNIF